LGQNYQTKTGGFSIKQGKIFNFSGYPGKFLNRGE
jgi:hypothetical protein